MTMGEVNLFLCRGSVPTVVSVTLFTAPEVCGGVQMQYGSIGWSVGATLGYQVAVSGEKRVIASIGDGSFQVTAQVASPTLYCSFSFPVDCKCLLLP